MAVNSWEETVATYGASVFGLESDTSSRDGNGRELEKMG